MFRSFQLEISNQMNELRRENGELKSKVMKNHSPTKASKSQKEFNPKRAQSSDKGYKKGPSTMQAALQKNNVLNNTVTQTSNPKKMSENSKKQQQGAETLLSIQSVNSFATMPAEMTMTSNLNKSSTNGKLN